MTERYFTTQLAPRLGEPDVAENLMSMRTNREKVAILLAALSKETAVSLLQKFDSDSITNLIESSGRLGDLSTGDFEPVAKEFFGEFGEALGISAGSKHLIPLLEAAFPQEKVSQLLGQSVASEKDAVWSKFTPNMESVLIPFLLDEHEQTVAAVLSRLPVDLASRCFALLPRELTSRVLSRSLSLRSCSPEALNLLEQTLEEQFFAKAVETNDSKWIERVASVVNRMDREQALSVLESLAITTPDQAAKLRKFIFMFEDLDQMDAKSLARLFDVIPAELVTPALWGMGQNFKDGILGSLSARARRMVESELGNDDGTPRNDSVAARKKIAETALAMARKGEIKLPDVSLRSNSAAAVINTS
jgi:flagellar motor switch protein FliG